MAGGGGKLDSPPPGREPERLNIEEEGWEEAVRKAIRKGRPKRWPEEKSKKDDEKEESGG